MAKKEEIAQRKQAIISQLAQSRVIIDHGRSSLKEKLNVKKQATKFVRTKPKTIFTGSALIGLLFTMLLRRPRRSRATPKKRTLKRTILSWALLLLKPTAKKWAKNSAKSYLIGKLTSLRHKHQPIHHPAEPKPIHKSVIHSSQQ